METITIDKEFEIPKYSPVCSFCIHLRGFGRDRKCEAFPKGIPLDIWNGDNPHTEKHPDQKNELFFLKK